MTSWTDPLVLIGVIAVAVPATVTIVIYLLQRHDSSKRSKSPGMPLQPAPQGVRPEIPAAPPKPIEAASTATEPKAVESLSAAAQFKDRSQLPVATQGGVVGPGAVAESAVGGTYPYPENRLGTVLSFKRVEEHVDHTHYFDLIHREDLLDYRQGDFFSLRRLKGRNASERHSSELVYSESSEVKVSFLQNDVKAIDMRTGGKLLVESLSDPEELLWTHAFRILFRRPVEPGEDFDIGYSIRIPGELTVLPPKSASMSVALVRVARGVRRLEYNVCLDFEPSAFHIRCADDQERTVACKGRAPVLRKFTEPDELESKLGVDPSVAPWRIEWATDEPTNKQYIIYYRR